MTINEAPSSAELATQAAARLRELTGIEKYDFALTLGSGWAKAADLLGETTHVIDAAEIPGFYASPVAGHTSSIRSITLRDGRRALVTARTHYYEGRGVAAVVHPARMAAAAGASVMILTNGAGGLKDTWSAGTPVLISDHINLTGLSPLEGPRFVDLTDLYSARLRSAARTVAPWLDEGVYTQFTGPHYETPAEIMMVKAMGGHIVGMSTALEAIAAREAGMEILGISLITNLAAGIQKEPLSHEDVIAAGKEAEPRISALLADVVHAL